MNLSKQGGPPTSNRLELRPPKRLWIVPPREVCVLSVLTHHSHTLQVGKLRLREGPDSGAQDAISHTARQYLGTSRWLPLQQVGSTL